MLFRSLIRVLLLQAITRLEARRAAKTLPSFKEAEPIAGLRVGLISPNPHDLFPNENVPKTIRE